MKKYAIKFNHSVADNLENIFSYIAAHDPQTAYQIIEGLEETIMSLHTMPERFSVIPENVNV
ncbi:MAG: type II toxin-antitoxin system RelE/ParE family toxin [Alphaproteobacteria bacterium]